MFQLSLREVGRLWQMNQISVAQEHYCTAATQLIMSQLYPYIFSGERRNRTLIAAYAGGLVPILCLTKTDLASPQPA